MAWQPTAYTVVGAVAATVAAGLGIQAWQNRGRREARPFLGLMVAAGGWSLAYAVGLGFSTLPEQLPYLRAGIVFGGLVPTLWLLFTVRYAGYDDALTRRRIFLLGVEPVAFGALATTNPVHGLLWGDPTLATTAGGPVAVFPFRAGYFLHVAYGYLLIGAGLGLLSIVALRASRGYRRQAATLVVGTLPPFAANVGYTLGVPYGPLPALDPTPFAFVVTGLLWGLALFEFDLLERTPIAHRQVLDEMGDGLVVTHDDGRVVDANAVARSALDPTPEIGRSVRAVAPDEYDDLETTLEALDGRTVTSTVEERTRAYDLDCSTLTDHRGETVGYVLALRDVTDRDEYQQRLEVAQRILRHNLRNEVNVIRGWAERVDDADAETRVAAVERIVETADDLVELSEKTGTMVQLRSEAAGEWETVAVEEVLAPLVERYRERHPDATVEDDVPETARIRAPGGKFLEIPVSNLIENAIEHNDAQNPWVRVRVEVDDESVRVHVEDDAPEIPEIERETLSSGTEKPLTHGSGVGLWLAYWSARAVGGSIAFAGRDPKGNVVTLEFPAA